jgi:hypothetical protein
MPYVCSHLPRARRISRILLALCALTGCQRTYSVPEAPLPPNTILLSQMMRQLSAKPGFTQSLLADFERSSNSGKQGPSLLTPTLFNNLRSLMLGSNWQGLDRFPGWTMRRINPTVDVADRFAGKSARLEDASAVHPGAPAATSQQREYLDVGPYALDQTQSLSLDQPSTFPPFTPVGVVTNLGDGVLRGDGPGPLAPEHPQSLRLADALNRLAANQLNHVSAFTVTFHNHSATTPEQLIADLAASGNTVIVNDTRYFANFGHLHFQSASGLEDVMMPFWIDSQLTVPNSGGRHLLIPAAHAELEWHVHGPAINADISYYFGVDGRSEWRTMDTLDQPWVLKRNAHAYAGADALRATHLATVMTVAYMHLHQLHPQLPFGGYYTLGVCQDGVSAVEKVMTGHVTLFPNTADDAYFTDPHDTTFNAMMAAIPRDRDGHRPQPERIFGSIPTDPQAPAGRAYNAVTIPGLAADLNATYAALQMDKHYPPHPLRNILLGLAITAASGICLILLIARERRK